MASRAILMRGLSCVHGKNLTSLVVSTRRAGGVTAHTGAALRALRKLRSMPAVGGLTGAQAHLRGFAFWNSHKIRIIDFLNFSVSSVCPERPTAHCREAERHRRAPAKSVLDRSCVHPHHIGDEP